MAPPHLSARSVETIRFFVRRGLEPGNAAAQEHAMTDQDDFPSRVRRSLSSHRAVKIDDRSLYAASVLLPFFASETGAPHLWLVRRAVDMRVHGGQVALP